jgi:hypothetical protein
MEDEFWGGMIIINVVFLFGFAFFTIMLKKEYEERWMVHALIILIIITIYHFYVVATATYRPGCYTYDSVSGGAHLEGGRRFNGRLWMNTQHWEHEIDFVPRKCDCVTYHWFWGDLNNFTEDSLIKGRFRGPNVKPDKIEYEEDIFIENNVIIIK